LTVETCTVDFQQAYTVLTGSVKIAGGKRGRGWLVHRRPIGSGDGLQKHLVATRSKHPRNGWLKWVRLPPPAPRKKPDVPLLKRPRRGSITPLAQGLRAFPSRRIMGSARTVKSWVELPTRVASVRQRKAVIRNWVVGNHFLADVPDTHPLSEGEKDKVWQNVYEASERGVSALRKGTIDIYQTINAMIDAMQGRGAAASTIFGHKFKLVKLFRYLKLGIDEDDLKQAVRPIDSSRVTDDKQPTREQIRNCILHGTTKQKAVPKGRLHLSA